MLTTVADLFEEVEKYGLGARAQTSGDLVTNSISIRSTKGIWLNRNLKVVRQLSTEDESTQ